jgi:hypothetical protein
MGGEQVRREHGTLPPKNLSSSCKIHRDKAYRSMRAGVKIGPLKKAFKHLKIVLYEK